MKKWCWALKYTSAQIFIFFKQSDKGMCQKILHLSLWYSVLFWIDVFCLPVGLYSIPLLQYTGQNETESRPHCLKRHGWEELNIHNTFPSRMMYLNHYHKWSKNPSWKKTLVCFSHLTITKNFNIPAARVCLYIKG